MEPNETFHLMSPNYPNSYLNNMDCVWIFRATTSINHHHFKVRFLAFETENTFDVLKVGIGDPTADNVTSSAEFHGTHTLNAISLDGDVMWMEFTSDNRITLTGFKIMIQTETKPCKWYDAFQCSFCTELSAEYQTRHTILEESPLNAISSLLKRCVRSSTNVHSIRVKIYQQFNFFILHSPSINLGTQFATVKGMRS